VNDPILADDETLEDLQRDGLRLIQKSMGSGSAKIQSSWPLLPLILSNGKTGAGC